MTGPWDPRLMGEAGGCFASRIRVQLFDPEFLRFFWDYPINRCASSITKGLSLRNVRHFLHEPSARRVPPTVVQTMHGGARDHSRSGLREFIFAHLPKANSEPQ
jgi:hypothetical protein